MNGPCQWAISLWLLVFAGFLVGEYAGDHFLLSVLLLTPLAVVAGAIGGRIAWWREHGGGR